MTDRECLLLAFGALKAVDTKYEKLNEMLLEIIEGHLFPRPVVMSKLPEYEPNDLGTIVRVE